METNFAVLKILYENLMRQETKITENSILQLFDEVKNCTQGVMQEVNLVFRVLCLKHIKNEILLTNNPAKFLEKSRNFLIRVFADDDLSIKDCEGLIRNVYWDNLPFDNLDPKCFEEYKCIKPHEEHEMYNFVSLCGVARHLIINKDRVSLEAIENLLQYSQNMINKPTIDAVMSKFVDLFDILEEICISYFEERKIDFIKDPMGYMLLSFETLNKLFGIEPDRIGRCFEGLKGAYWNGFPIENFDFNRFQDYEVVRCKTARYHFLSDCNETRIGIKTGNPEFVEKIREILHISRKLPFLQGKEEQFIANLFHDLQSELEKLCIEYQKQRVGDFAVHPQGFKDSSEELYMEFFGIIPRKDSSYLNRIYECFWNELELEHMEFGSFYMYHRSVGCSHKKYILLGQCSETISGLRDAQFNNHEFIEKMQDLMFWADKSKILSLEDIKKLSVKIADECLRFINIDEINNLDIWIYLTSLGNQDPVAFLIEKEILTMSLFYQDEFYQKLREFLNDRDNFLNLVNFKHALEEYSKSGKEGATAAKILLKNIREIKGEKTKRKIWGNRKTERAEKVKLDE